MSDSGNVARSLRERLEGTTEERLGRALSDLLENPLLTGVIGRAFDAREKAVQAQEVAMGALNIPSAADIERLTRRLRSVSHRLEGIEDGVQRLDRALSPAGVEGRLSAIEEKLERLSSKLETTRLESTAAMPAVTTKPATSKPAASKPATTTKPATRTKAARKTKAAGKTTASRRTTAARKNTAATKGKTGAKAGPATKRKAGAKAKSVTKGKAAA